MRFTLAQLEAFYWIVRLGRFQDAALQLNLTQPTVSQRIRELEQALGVTLFDRIGRHARLTSDGKALLELTTVVLSESWKISETLGNHAVRGRLGLGMPENFACACLGELLRVLGRDHTELTLEVAIGTSRNLASDLEGHRLEAAILGDPHTTAMPEMRFVPLGKHPMVWVAGPGFDLAEPIAPSDIRDLPIICAPEPELQHQMINDWFRTGGIAPRSLNTCTSISVVADLVAAGVGLSMLPPSILQPHHRSSHIKLLASYPHTPDVHVFFAYHPSNAGSNMDAVLNAIREILPRVPFLEPEDPCCSVDDSLRAETAVLLNSFDAGNRQSAHSLARRRF